MPDSRLSGSRDFSGWLVVLPQGAVASTKSKATAPDAPPKPCGLRTHSRRSSKLCPQYKRKSKENNNGPVAGPALPSPPVAGAPAAPVAWVKLPRKNQRLEFFGTDRGRCGVPGQRRGGARHRFFFFFRYEGVLGALCATPPSCAPTALVAAAGTFRHSCAGGGRPGVRRAVLFEIFHTDRW